MERGVYFVRYSISKFRDFSRIFLEFFSEIFRDFSDFEHIYQNATPIFKVKIYRNVPLIVEVINLQKCHSSRSQSKARISLN